MTHHGWRSLLLVCAMGTAIFAQPPFRRATTIEALRLYSGFYHAQPVVVRGELMQHAGHALLRSGEAELRLIAHDSLPPDGTVEVRGQLLDIGRLQQDDPRLQAMGLREQIQAIYKDHWPKPGESLMLDVNAATEAGPPPAPTIRTIALDPRRYAGDRVTVVGQFRGRNLYGDLPDAPGETPQDFVVRSGDASIWVTNLRPRGKGFDLNVSARVDTGRWVEVSGVVRHGRGLVWLDGQQIELAKEPADARQTSEPAAVVPAPQGPPIEVVFSSPVQDDTDVAGDRPVRVQFSRNLDPSSLNGRVRVSYLAAQSGERDEPQGAVMEVTTAYDPGARALVITPTRPFERFRTVKVELLDGIVGTDRGPLKPFTLVFSVGGSE